METDHEGVRCSICSTTAWRYAAAMLLIGCTHGPGAVVQPRADMRSSAAASHAGSLPAITTAHRLLRLEAELTVSCRGLDGDAWYRTHAVPLDAFIEKARIRLRSLGHTVPQGMDQSDVAAAFKQVDVTLHELGFAVCLRTQSLSQSLGTPLPISTPDARELSLEDGTCVLLRSPSYRDALIRRHAEVGLRPVDCDLSSLLYLALAETLHWPVRFVEVPAHNFVRWRFPDGSYLNWDTNDGQAYTDEEYRLGKPLTMGAFDLNRELSNGYLVDQTYEQIEAYYLSLVSSKLKTADCAEAAFARFRGRKDLAAVVYNNFAWEFATNPVFQGTGLADEAPGLSIQATAKSPECNYWDTLSCAYAAVGDFKRAVEIERHISERSPRIAAFEAGHDCYDETVARDGGCPDDETY